MVVRPLINVFGEKVGFHGCISCSHLEDVDISGKSTSVADDQSLCSKASEMLSERQSRDMLVSQKYYQSYIALRATNLPNSIVHKRAYVLKIRLKNREWNRYRQQLQV